MNACIDCFVVLELGENWTKSLGNNRMYLCRKCDSDRNKARVRTPRGWAVSAIASPCIKQRRGARELPQTITPTQLLDKAYDTDGHCEHCNEYAGLPWDHVGDRERGLDVDHKLNLVQIRARGRKDFNSIDNIWFLCKPCHTRKTTAERRGHTVLDAPTLAGLLPPLTEQGRMELMGYHEEP